jgi:predicted transcriptional regulator
VKVKIVIQTGAGESVPIEELRDKLGALERELSNFGKICIEMKKNSGRAMGMEKLRPMERMKKAIRKHLSKHVELTRRELAQFANATRSDADLDEILKGLVDSGVVGKKERGKTEVYFLTENAVSVVESKKSWSLEKPEELKEG